ncbi:MAG TPA: hypothetical protein PL072_09035 [Phycisphaerales bacterium]|nr:hypothetical protein [Phycisphaerales bacterium]
MSLAAKLSRVMPGRMAYEINRLRKQYFPQQRHVEEKALLEAIGSRGEVMSGPFKGMKYVTTVAATNLADELLGTYELELHPAIENMIAFDPELVIDIGTATGYYAVGFARRCANARVIGYDISSYARAVTRRVAAVNGLSGRVEVRAACTSEELEREVSRVKRAAIFSDCEGYEDVLMDPARSPALKNAYLLVEVHDMFVPGVSRRVMERFAQTHTLTKYAPRQRTAADLPPGVKLDARQFDQAMNEHRQASSAWLELRPRG